MKKLNVVGYKIITKNDKDYILCYLVADEPTNGVIGFETFTAFVHPSHLDKYNITLDNLVTSTCYRYAIKKIDGTYDTGITFKKGV